MEDSDPARWRCDPWQSSALWSNWAFVNCMARASCFKKKRSLLEVVLKIRYQGWGRCFQPLLVQKWIWEKMFLEHYFDRYTFQPEKDWLLDLKERSRLWVPVPRLIGHFSLKGPCLRPEDFFSSLWSGYRDEYIQIHQEQLQGNFVGQVREACHESLARIRQACFEVEEFLYPQAKRLMAYISLHYQERLSICGRDLRNPVLFDTETPLSGMVSLWPLIGKTGCWQVWEIEVLNVKSDK